MSAAEHIRHTLLNTKTLTEVFSWEVRCHLLAHFSGWPSFYLSPEINPKCWVFTISTCPQGSWELCTAVHLSCCLELAKPKETRNKQVFILKEAKHDWQPQSNLPANQFRSFSYNAALPSWLIVECFTLWPKENLNFQVTLFNQNAYCRWLISLHFIDIRQSACKSLEINCFPEVDVQWGCPLSWMLLSSHPREIVQTDEPF